MDTIGRITVPSFTPINIFPLKTEFPHGRAQKRLVISHSFGSANAKIEQRFYVGSPATRWTFHRPRLSNTERTLLRNFWEAQQGSTLPFFYDAPNEDQTVTRRTVYFEQAPLSLQELDTSCSVGLTFVEIPDPASIVPLTLNNTVPRFPDTTLTSALLDQVQNMIPLIRIRVLDSLVPDIFLSDQRVQIGSQLYLPRLLRIGEPGSGVLISQSTDGSSDDAQFSFGNADRVMVQVANDTQLMWARVELSFFHVGTGIKIDLWAGYVIDWTSDSGPEMTVKCSDILSALTKSSPVSLVSRVCYRRLAKDGCPYNSLVDTRDLVHFPTASTTVCDLGYNTPNGCMAHGIAVTAQSYGATYCAPQKVLLVSKGIGVTSVGGLVAGGLLLGGIGAVAFGIGSTSTWYPRTSLISDTIYGNSLPEIWHNDDGIPQYALPVNCKIAAGRDETEYYIALGIVGRGPLGAFTMAQMYDSNADGIKDAFAGSTLDGQPNHGFQVTSLGLWKPNGDGSARTFGQAIYGLRQVLGTDPAGVHDYFSLGRVSLTGNGWFQQPSDNSWMKEVAFNSIVAGDGGNNAYNQVFAAGVAFCEIRRTKPGQDPLSSPDQHQMIAEISQGLTGLAWTAPGSRTTIPGCTNPFWVAVNTLLSAVGVTGAATAIQETYFDAASAISTADIADLTPARIIGTGTETQFRFKGSIDARKPTRDWLQAILNSASGYFVWSFGKLKLGCRSNASAVSAFNSGNVLFNSLRLSPVIPKFEKLTISFADQEYKFQSNTIDLTDQDHAARYNRSQNPLASVFALSGCSTKSQAGRLAIARSREELGGVTQAEQDNARLAAWKTTVLALETEAGMVVSLADPDIPTGTGNFRIERWSLNRDYSIDIQGKSVTASMYDMTMGPKPADIESSPVPIEALPSVQVLPWNPGFEGPIQGDSMFVAKGFGVQPVPLGAADGSPISQVAIYGNPPLSIPSTLIGKPQILSAVVGGTGGTIPAGAYTVGMTAFDSATVRSAVSALVTVVVPSGSTNRITITVQWPPSSFGGNVFVGVADDGHGLKYEAAFDSGISTNGTAVAYDLLAITGKGFGVPDPNFDHIEIDVLRDKHAGSWALPVTVVAPTTLKFTGQTFTVNNFSGCDLSLLAFADLTKNVAIADLYVVSNTADTFTIGANSAGVSPPDLTTLFTTGDLFVMRMSPTAFDAISFTDSRLANPVSDFGLGLAIHKESGNLAYVIKGKGAWQSPKPIADNDHTKVTLASPWDIPVDATSRIVILAPALSDTVITQPLKISTYTGGSGYIATLLMANELWATFFVMAYTADAQGVRSAIPSFREIFLQGAQGTRRVTGSTTQLTTDGLILCDTSTITPPAAVSLSAPGMTIGTTACPVSDGTNTVNGTFLKVDTAGNLEYLLVVSGGGTAGAVTLVVVRAQMGTVAVAHLAAVSVVLPGALSVTLLAASLVPNQKLAISKTTTDINYVRLNRGGTDTWPGGATSRIIPGNTTYYMQFPG